MDYKLILQLVLDLLFRDLLHFSSIIICLLFFFIIFEIGLVVKEVFEFFYFDFDDF